MKCAHRPGQNQKDRVRDPENDCCSGLHGTMSERSSRVYYVLSFRQPTVTKGCIPNLVFVLSFNLATAIHENILNRIRSVPRRVSSWIVFLASRLIVIARRLQDLLRAQVNQDRESCCYAPALLLLRSDQVALHRIREAGHWRAWAFDRAPKTK